MIRHSRIGFFLFALLCPLPASAHELINLDARRATPGLRIELIKISSANTSASNPVEYQLGAIGFPPGVVFNVWAKEFAQSFHQLASGFKTDTSGVLVSNSQGSGKRLRRLDQMKFRPGPYPRGAIWEIAVVSTDRVLAAFAKTVPHLIAARDGSCGLSLEMVSRQGNRFLATGSGFVPGEDVTTESRYSERLVEKRVRISAQGLLPPQVILHGESGSDRAHYAVKARSCEVTVDYEWGEAALTRR